MAERSQNCYWTRDGGKRGRPDVAIIIVIHSPVDSPGGGTGRGSLCPPCQDLIEATQSEQGIIKVVWELKAVEHGCADEAQMAC